MALMKKTNNIVAAKIVAMTKKIITVVTENGQQVNVPITNQERQDNLFIASIKDIWQAGIWIPVNKEMHKLLQYDWLKEPENV